MNHQKNLGFIDGLNGHNGLNGHLFMKAGVLFNFG